MKKEILFPRPFYLKKNNNNKVHPLLFSIDLLRVIKEIISIFIFYSIQKLLTLEKKISLTSFTFFSLLIHINFLKLEFNLLHLKAYKI
jgi:hypothetical protein